jgi:sulfate transport system permease protein
MARSEGARSLRPGQYAIVLAACTYILLILILPIVALVSRAFAHGPAPLLAAAGDPTARGGLILTLLLAVIAVLANGIAGVAGALVMVRERFLARRVLDALVDLPLAVSPVMTGLAFLLVFGRDGWLEPALSILDLKVTFAFPGLVLATLFVTFPFTLREVAYVLAELGTDEEQAAATLGASAWQTFWLVTLPNIRFGVGYGIVLTLARALGEFGAVLVIGGAISGKTQTATTFIYNAVEERQEPAAYAMALVLAFTSIALLVVIEWLKRRRSAEG